MPTEILYPFAYSDEKAVVLHIDDTPRVGGHRYSCVHCGDRMNAVVQVTKKTPHFRHHPDTEPCDPDDYLHTAAIETVRQAHSDALKRDCTYKLTRHCWNCEAFSTEIDLADEWICAKEHSIVEHTRSDLVFTHTDGRRIIVEVVVTHNMEPETRAAYENAGIPVAVIRPTLETLNNLSYSLHIKDSLNFGSNRCFRCEERYQAEREAERKEREREAERERSRRKTVDIVLSRMKRETTPSAPEFRPWYCGKHQTPMYPKTQRKVFANAVILISLGFKQHNPANKPWLFRYPIHEREKVFLYADLGGSDIVPIYEDTAAMLYVFPDSEPINHYIIGKASERLQQFGVDVRTGFLSSEQVERVGVSPLRYVDEKILSKWIRQVPPRRGIN